VINEIFVRKSPEGSFLRKIALSRGTRDKKTHFCVLTRSSAFYTRLNPGLQRDTTCSIITVREYMSRLRKRLQIWLTDPPTDAPIDEVEGIIKRYFQGKVESKSGSHRVIRDERLAGHAGFEPFGEFSIPVKGGRRVKGHYLQRLARAVQIIERVEGAEHEEL
jgi:hypothetical protein